MKLSKGCLHDFNLCSFFPPLFWLSFQHQFHPETMNHGHSARDSISNLPSNLIENILMHLPLKEAARTSILSRKWRFNWARIPALIFDDTFSQKSGPTETTPATQDKLLLTMYQILLLHQTPIRKLNICISTIESCVEINQMIHFLSRNVIENFSLSFVKGVEHKLPSHFFSCWQLKHLSLANCILKPPSGFQGFRKLISLDLYNVIFDGYSAQHFISSCSLLEVLMLTSPSASVCLEINAPKLLYLFIGGTFKSISFKNVQRLVYASLIPKMISWETSNIEEFCNCLLSLEVLAISYTHLTILATSKLLKGPLSRLKKLCLGGTVYKRDDLLGAFYLISNSPNLTTITIQAVSYPYDHVLDMKSLELQESNLSLNHLREVHVENFFGLRPELEFIQLLLAKSVRLKKVHIRPRAGDEKETDSLKKLLEFPRASPMVVIKYLDPKQV